MNFVWEIAKDFFTFDTFEPFLPFIGAGVLVFVWWFLFGRKVKSSVPKWDEK